MAIDVLELQLVSALQRFAALQRRAESDRDQPKLLARTLEELEGALEEVRVAQEQLIEGRTGSRRPRQISPESASATGSCSTRCLSPMS